MGIRKWKLECYEIGSGAEGVLEIKFVRTGGFVGYN